MCLAVPARILSIEGQEAEVDFSGVRRRISVALTPEARVGDYVVIHTGFAISVLDEAEALETLKLFQELDEFTAQMLQDTDNPVSQSAPNHELSGK
ncbi:MAG: HypC/HybG/HupF family hydrogenase formation chaperone [Chloroflexi bacterium]|nr:HypC/HybG/HupF family hydrogenase formation chaperone [Chloroflexota bacterium]